LAVLRAAQERRERVRERVLAQPMQQARLVVQAVACRACSGSVAPTRQAQERVASEVLAQAVSPASSAVLPHSAMQV
jgi:hypothetical protein